MRWPGRRAGRAVPGACRGRVRRRHGDHPSTIMDGGAMGLRALPLLAVGADAGSARRRGGGRGCSLDGDAAPGPRDAGLPRRQFGIAGAGVVDRAVSGFPSPTCGRGWPGVAGSGEGFWGSSNHAYPVGCQAASRCVARNIASLTVPFPLPKGAISEGSCAVHASNFCDKRNQMVCRC